MARKNTIAKSGSEAFDLRFDRVRHVDLATERHVAISPKRMLAARRARFIKQTLLRNENKRPLRNFSIGHGALRVCKFGDRPAEMDRAGASTRLCFPWNRRRQRVIDFENAGRVPKIFQAPTIIVWQSVAHYTRKLPNRGVEKDRARFWNLIESVDATVDVDLATQLGSLFCQRVRVRLRSDAR